MKDMIYRRYIVFCYDEANHDTYAVFCGDKFS